MARPDDERIRLSRATCSTGRGAASGQRSRRNRPALNIHKLAQELAYRRAEARNIDQECVMALR